MNNSDWVKRGTIKLSNGSEYIFPLDRIDSIMEAVKNKEMIKLKDGIINSSFIIEIKNIPPYRYMNDEEIMLYAKNQKLI